MKDQKLLLYTITVLTVLTVIAVLFSNLFEFGDLGFRKWGLAAVLAEIIGLFVLIVKTSFKQKQINIFFAVPDNLHYYANNLSWDNNCCFIILGERKEKIKLTKTDIGPSFKVHFSADILCQLMEFEIFEFELKELNGNKWRVGPFNLYDRTRNLECLETNLTNANYD
jgi:hypothetical protein